VIADESNEGLSKPGESKSAVRLIAACPFSERTPPS